VVVVARTITVNVVLAGEQAPVNKVRQLIPRNQTTSAVKLVSIAISAVVPRFKLLMALPYNSRRWELIATAQLADCTGQVIWNSSNPAIASVSYSGLATAVTLGNTDLPQAHQRP